MTILSLRQKDLKTGLCEFFLSVEFATSLLASLAGDNNFECVCVSVGVGWGIRGARGSEVSYFHQI